MKNKNTQNITSNFFLIAIIMIFSTFFAFAAVDETQPFHDGSEVEVNVNGLKSLQEAINDDLCLDDGTNCPFSPLISRQVSSAFFGPGNGIINYLDPGRPDSIPNNVVNEGLFWNFPDADGILEFPVTIPQGKDGISAIKIYLEAYGANAGQVEFLVGTFAVVGSMDHAENWDASGQGYNVVSRTYDIIEINSDSFAENKGLVGPGDVLVLDIRRSNLGGLDTHNGAVHVYGVKVEFGTEGNLPDIPNPN